MASLDVSLRRRVVIENVLPSVDDGRFPIARTVGERVIVRADVFADGHDSLAAVLLHRPAGSRSLAETAMVPLGNNRWQASFVVEQLGTYEYTVEGWIDRFTTWRTELGKKVAAGQSVTSELLEGAELVKRRQSTRAGARTPIGCGRQSRRSETSCARRRIGWPRRWMPRCSRQWPRRPIGARRRDTTACSASASSASGRASARGTRCSRARQAPIQAAAPPSPKPRPRCLRQRRWASTSSTCRRSIRSDAASARDATTRCRPGRTIRAARGRSAPRRAATRRSSPGSARSTTSIGSSPRRRGTASRSRSTSRSRPRPIIRGSREHPEWFRHRPDGTIKYAENPPKKYQDIYPINFESEDWQALWHELKRVIEFWIGHGVTIFRVDNPHTKPFRFWEWALAEIKREHPDTIFLSEAFTRPKVMRYLAKVRLLAVLHLLHLAEHGSRS